MDLRKAIKDFGLSFFSLWLVFSVGGVTLSHHYCMHSQQSYKSIFVKASCTHPTESAHGHDSDVACCPAEANSCCADSEENSASNCCDEEIEFFRIETPFTKNSNTEFPHPPSFDEPWFDQVMADDAELANALTQQHVVWDFQIPPNKGRKLIILYSCPKIPVSC